MGLHPLWHEFKNYNILGQAVRDHIFPDGEGIHPTYLNVVCSMAVKQPTLRAIDIVSSVYRLAGTHLLIARWTRDPDVTCFVGENFIPKDLAHEDPPPTDPDESGGE